MPELSVCETTRRALLAAEAGDLEDLGRALADREAAIATASPEQQAAALADGALLGLRLAEMKLKLVAEHGRLEQVREGLATYCEFDSSCSRPCIDVRG